MNHRSLKIFAYATQPLVHMMNSTLFGVVFKSACEEYYSSCIKLNSHYHFLPKDIEKNFFIGMGRYKSITWDKSLEPWASNFKFRLIHQEVVLIRDVSVKKTFIQKDIIDEMKLLGRCYLNDRSLSSLYELEY